MNYEWEKDGLVIDGNTIYEIDLNCYECLSKEEKEQCFGEIMSCKHNVPFYRKDFP